MASVSLKKILAESAREERGRHSELTMDELVEFSRNRLEDAEAERVREILSVDPTWAQIYLDLKEPDRLQAAPLAEREIEEAWHRFEGGLETPSMTSRNASAAPSRVWWSPQTLAALAAGALLAVLVWTSLGTVQDLTPRVYAMSAVEDGVVQRGGEREITATDDDLLVLLLTVQPTRDSTPVDRARYEVRRVEDTSGLILDGEAVQQEDGTYAVSLPAAELPPGLLKLQIWSPDGAGAGPRYDYFFILRK